MEGIRIKICCGKNVVRQNCGTAIIATNEGGVIVGDCSGIELLLAAKSFKLLTNEIFKTLNEKYHLSYEEIYAYLNNEEEEDKQ